jgi:hypothetical protein
MTGGDDRYRVPWRYTGAIALAAVVVLLLVALGAFVYGPTDDCPPLGNGGAMHVENVDRSVPNASVAVAVVRDSRLAAPAATTVPTSEASTGPTSEATTGAPSERTRSSSTRTTDSRLTTGGHFHGSEQVHRHIAVDGATPEHYHVHVTDDRANRLGFVVTADGDLYRVLLGDC